MPDFDDRYRRFEEAPRRTAINWGISGIGIILVLLAVGGAGFFVLNLASQPARIVQKTFDADNVLFNYEWFRTQYADIGAMEPKIANAIAARAAFEDSAGPRSGWKLSDRQQWDQLNRIVLGLQNQRVTMVAEYNGNASKANRSIFMAGLPDHIN